MKDLEACGPLEHKLDQLIGTLRGAAQRMADLSLMRDTVSLLESREWHFDHRGDGRWFCPTCGVEFPNTEQNKKHKPDCTWLSVTDRLRKLISGLPQV